MLSDDGELAITFNGEIYNFHALREDLQKRGYHFHTETDTEVMLNAYREFGLDFLTHLEGMFAFALWDRKRRQLLLARDRTGIKPLFYYQQGDGLAFDRDHVYVAPFRDGAWAAPQRVDVGQAFDSSWARIGAGNGGRLVVTWVQESGIDSDRIYSATLDPGATGFQAPVPVDFNVGEATATHPDLAMARGGQAYLAYRVVTDTSAANPPGYLGADVRVARYNGRLWSVLGTPVDRNQAVPVRNPTEGNAPRIAIDIPATAMRT